MSRPEAAEGSSRTFTLGLVVSVVAVLYFAKEVLEPLALAVLLSFLLAPLVRRLEHWKVGRVPSVLIVAAAAFITLGMIGWVVAGQLLDLAENLPSYQHRISQKIESLRPPKGGLIEKIQRAVDEFNRELADGAAASAPQPATPTTTPAAEVPTMEAPTVEVLAKSPARPARPGQPVPVVVVESGPSAWAYISAVLTPLVGALAMAGIVVLFVLFMLIEREDLRNRIIRLIGPAQIHVTTQVLDDAAYRVSRYLFMQLIINGSFGIVIALVLALIGLPNAILWGLMAALLRYIPYLGPLVAAAIPCVLSLAVFDGWSQVLMTVGLFVVMELISNNLMEPILYRTSTGVSTIGILVAAVFWTWLWGSVGLVLSTPMTVCIAVLGRYVPQLEFLNVLLTDEPVLEPGPHYYQRLLAEDQEEATLLLERHLEQSSLVEVYDKVMMPALVLAEADRHRGALDEGKLLYIFESMRESIEEFGERAIASQPPAAEDAAVETPHALRTVVCLPARDEADEIASVMFCQVLLSRGYAAQFVSVKALASEMLDAVEKSNAGVVCVSAVPPFASRHARYLCKRLRPRFANVKIVVGLWSETPGKKLEARLRAADADKVVSTFAQALEQM